MLSLVNCIQWNVQTGNEQGYAFNDCMMLITSYTRLCDAYNDQLNSIGLVRPSRVKYIQHGIYHTDVDKFQ